MATIRPYRSTDAEQVARIFFESVHTLGLGPYTQTQINAWAPMLLDTQSIDHRLADGRTFLVAVNANDVALAYGDLKLDGHVDHLYCHPSMARRGLGTALYLQLEKTARTRQLRYLSVDTSEAARPLFEHLGFKLVERREFELRGVSIHNYRMLKAL